jgi:hypothetical protein
VRRVDEDPHPVHLGDELAAVRGQPDVRVVVAAARRPVRPVVCEEAGADAELVVRAQQGDLAVERLRPLQVERDREAARALRLVDVVEGRREHEAPGPR